MPWEIMPLDWTLLNTIPWNTVPVLAIVVAVAAAIGFGPLLRKRAAPADVTATRTATAAPKQAIVEVFDAENVDDIAMAHVIRLLRDGKLELAKTALELAIAQRGQS